MSKHSGTTRNDYGPDGRILAALRGKPTTPRVRAAFGPAARWLAARGFDDAAAALAAAARVELGPFWTERRLEALSELARGEFPIDYPEEPWGTGALLLNASTVIGGAGLFLAYLSGSSLSSAHAVRIRRALAVLLVAIRDAEKAALDAGGVVRDKPF